MVEDQAEPLARVDTLVERDLDHLAEPLVHLGRLVGLDRLGDGLFLGDRPVVGPGRADLADVEQAAADVADRLDVPFLVLGPGRLGDLGERPGLDQRQAEVVPGLEQPGVEQGAELAPIGQELDELVERLGRARCRQGPVERLEIGVGLGGAHRVVIRDGWVSFDRDQVTGRRTWTGREPWPGLRAGRRRSWLLRTSSRSSSSAYW